MKKTIQGGVQIKDADLGLIEAVFCRFDVVDKDGDVHRKGCFTKGQKVVISAYGHGSWEGRLPVGKGYIEERGDEAVMVGQFFLDTTHGLDTWKTVVALSEDDLQEWSYSLHDVKAERGSFDGKNVRFLNKVGLVKEVSPTLMGAGIETGTLSTKAADDAPETKQLASSVSELLYRAGRDRFAPAWCWVDDYDLDAGFVVYGVEQRNEAGVYSTSLWQLDATMSETAATLGPTETEVHRTSVFLPKGGRFEESKQAALGGVKALVEMATERLTLRAEKGKSTTEQRAAYDEIVEALEPLKMALEAPPNSTPDEDDTTEAAAQEILRSLAALNRSITTP